MSDDRRPIKAVPTVSIEERVAELERGFAKVLSSDTLPPAPAEPLVLIFDRDDLISLGLALAGVIVGAVLAARIGAA